MKKINREELIQILQSVQPGLSKREIIEQSSCFVFQDGEVITFNDEVSCARKIPLDIEGAVKADPLLALLQKMTEEEITIEQTDKELLVKGVNREAGFLCEAKVNLPIDSVDSPGKWRDLPKEFEDAVGIVQYCASSDQTQFERTCIHITADLVEACDNSQAARMKFKTGLEHSILVRRDSLRHIVGLGMSKVSETESWIHFKNPTGLILSCRRSLDSYPSLDSLFKGKGHKVVLPEGLEETADKAAIFSKENVDDSQLTIDLIPGKGLKVEGRGVTGWFKERKRTTYSGPAISFLIAPELLTEISHRGNECEVSEVALRVNGGKWQYVTAVGSPEAE